jgi:hypothetical protein
MSMKALGYAGLVAFLSTLPADGQQANGPSSPPLMIEMQGSFFIGGTVRHADAASAIDAGPFTRTADGHIKSGPMYVQYQIPVEAKHLPIVMIHGCCLSGSVI